MLGTWLPRPVDIMANPPRHIFVIVNGRGPEIAPRRLRRAVLPESPSFSPKAARKSVNGFRHQNRGCFQGTRSLAVRLSTGIEAVHVISGSF